MALLNLLQLTFTYFAYFFLLFFTTQKVSSEKVSYQIFNSLH
jgi:hypothetical protein